jgi:hypothetical protein
VVLAERVVLHVGAMKSGTSYLQSLLVADRDGLARHGVLVPGTTWNDQVVAVRQVLSRPEDAPRWTGLVDEISAHPGLAVVSMEFLGPSRPEVAARVVRSFGATPVEVVVTARDLNRTIASMWQETVQNGRSWGWDEYVADVRAKRPGQGDGVADRSTAGGTFWRQQHVARICRDWTSVVGQERCTLVTVPPPGAPLRELADRFASAAGLSFTTTTVPAGSNPSLGLASTLALRRLNELLDERGLRFPAGQRLRKRRLAKEILASRRREEPALGLGVTDWVLQQTTDTRVVLQQDGVTVVGALADLDPVDVPGVHPSELPDAEIAEAAVFGLAGLLEGQIRD